MAHVFPGGLENPELLKLARDRIQPLLDEINA
jgi:Na+-transporting NADH:ubiquinone oxidoreductase subunit NqrC